jgi:hypothetical protein
MLVHVNRPFLVCLLTLPLLLLRAAPADEAGDELAKALQELYSAKDRLFDKKEYKALRKVYADSFERKYQDQIKKAYGEDHDTLTAWLNENAEIKEEFYTAVHEKHDNVEAALRLFKDLYKQYPDKAKAYWNLAVATALTWDDPRKVYDYAHHQVRVRGTMPEGLIGATENFKYFLDNEQSMQGRGQLLPWEFLVHAVNHKTPLEERKWALRNYLGKRVMFGQCYKDVPYDHGMLKDPDAARLKDYPYTLDNIRTRGGVCAMQADFAARVGKSLGVPAEYIRGEGNSGGRHAWVMWVELKQVTKAQILFTLESHGRYNVDKYYTGDLPDPQTGQPMLDRDMELRLTVVGLDRQAKRHAGLVMRAFPLLRDRLALDVPAQMAYLDKGLAVNPYNEEAWLTLAQLSKDGKIDKGQAKKMITYANRLLKTFAKFPDFTWKVMDDLLAVHDDLAEKKKLYEALVASYEAADRPDLACQARLKLVGYQVAEKKFQDAARGLVITVLKFPGEGRYVPRLMDQLEVCCKNYKGGNEYLMAFYPQYLPKIPTKRGGEVSKYCIDMHTKAIAFFKENNRPREADLLQKQLIAIKASGKSS